MSFDKIPISGFDNNEIKYDKEPYPKPPEGSNLPFPYYTCLCIGATNSGKTVAVVKLLKYLEKAKYYNKDGIEVPQRIWIMSPTIKANPIYFTLKNLDPNDVIPEYSDAILNDILEEIRAIKKEAEAYQKALIIWNKYLKAKNDKFISDDEIIALELMNWSPPKPPKYPIPPVNQMILDDLVCSSGAFRATGDSAISNLSVKARHETCNVYILAQSASQIPKVIRTQASLLFLYRFNSKKITEDLYDTVSGLLTPEEFENIYHEATSEKYNYLVVDNTGSDLILKQNLNYLIQIKRKSKSARDNKKIKSK